MSTKEPWRRWLIISLLSAAIIPIVAMFIENILQLWTLLPYTAIGYGIGIGMTTRTVIKEANKAKQARELADYINKHTLPQMEKPKDAV